MGDGTAGGAEPEGEDRLKYSVALPRVEAADLDRVKRSLERARSLWAEGDHRDAIALVRAAAAAAAAAGQLERAATLEAAVVTLVLHLGATEGPSARGSTPPVTARPRAPVVHDHPTARPKRAASSRPRSSESTRLRPTAPGRRPKRPEREDPVVTFQTLDEDPSISIGELSTEATLSSDPPPRSLERPAEGSEEVIVVTVARADWKLASGEAIVGHLATRVAVMHPAAADGSVRIRPLGPGEVAPAGTRIALLVALEPGAVPLSETG